MSLLHIPSGKLTHTVEETKIIIETYTHTHTNKVSLLYGKQKMMKIIDKKDKCGTKFNDQLKFLPIIHIPFFAW